MKGKRTTSSRFVTRQITFKESLWTWIADAASIHGFDEPKRYLVYLLYHEQFRDQGVVNARHRAWQETLPPKAPLKRGSHSASNR